MKYTISTENEMLELKIQDKINECLDRFISFCFDAGAGAGKTYALQKAMEHILKKEGDNLKLRNQKILCITYTNAAKNEILNRIGKNSTVLVSTIHEFLWSFISNQQKLLTLEHEKKVREELQVVEKRIKANPLFNKINYSYFKIKVLNNNFLKIFYNHYGDKAADFKAEIKGYDKDFEKYLGNVSNFKTMVNNLNNESKLEITLKEIERGNTGKIVYNPNQNRDKLEKYVISHETLLVYCKNIISNYILLKRLFSDRYPYVLIDEYQDTSEKVINIIDSIREYSSTKKNFVVGFFGDSLQNIYSSGVGCLPKKEEYTIIEKKYNRRSSEQIIELIEKIRNDDFGQISIYNNFNNGSYKFYKADENFDLDVFLKKNDLIKDTACLLMKNDDISKARGFNALLSILKKFPKFSGTNYENISNEFLQKNIQQIGWFLRNILSFVDFLKKSIDGNSTVNEIIQFVPGSKKILTFKDMNRFIKKVKEANFLALTIEECINKVIGINGEISGKDILNNIFSIDYNCENILMMIKTRAYDYFYYSQDVNGESEGNLKEINDFFELDILQFIKWYEFVLDDLNKKDISYYTLHGSKGLEFENVVVVLQDDFAKRKNYCNYFFSNYHKVNTNDIQFNEVRNLLYVACSRARLNLYVVYYGDISGDSLTNINNIFGKIYNLN